MASLQAQLRLQHRSLPGPGIEVSPADSGPPEELKPSSPVTEPSSPSDLEPKHTTLRPSSYVDSVHESRASTTEPSYLISSAHPADADPRNITQNPSYSMSPGHGADTEPRRIAPNPSNLNIPRMGGSNVSASRPVSFFRPATGFLSDLDPTKPQKKGRWKYIKAGLELIGQGLQPRRS
jgi:hypothetical protein